MSELQAQRKSIVGPGSYCKRGVKGDRYGQAAVPFTHWPLATLHIGWEGYVDIDARGGGEVYPGHACVEALRPSGKRASGVFMRRPRKKGRRRRRGGQQGHVIAPHSRRAQLAYSMLHGICRRRLSPVFGYSAPFNRLTGDQGPIDCLRHSSRWIRESDDCTNVFES